MAQQDSCASNIEDPWNQADATNTCCGGMRASNPAALSVFTVVVACYGYICPESCMLYLVNMPAAK